MIARVRQAACLVREIHDAPTLDSVTRQALIQELHCLRELAEAAIAALSANGQSPSLQVYVPPTRALPPRRAQVDPPLVVTVPGGEL